MMVHRSGYRSIFRDASGKVSYEFFNVFDLANSHETDICCVPVSVIVAPDIVRENHIA